MACSMTHSRVARWRTSFQTSSSTTIEAPSNGPAGVWPAATAAQVAFEAASRRGDGVLEGDEDDGGVEVVGDPAGVEHQQRRVVGREGRGAVKQRPVGAVAAELLERPREAAQGGDDLGGAVVVAGFALGVVEQRVAQRALARRGAGRGGARVDVADGGGQQRALQGGEAVVVGGGVVVADQQRVQPHEEGDLALGDGGGVGGVPGVDHRCVGEVGGELEVRGAGEQLAGEARSGRASGRGR